MCLAHAGVLLFVSDDGDALSVDFGDAGNQTVLLMMVSVGACDSHGCEMMLMELVFRIRFNYSAA